MEKINIKYSVDTLTDICFEKIVSVCRKGKFIFVICDGKDCRNKVIKEIKKHLSSYRGLFTHKGIVAVVSKKTDLDVEKYFDNEITLERESNGRN